MIFGRQPAFWIGLIVTIIFGALQTLTGQGIISDALNSQITDGVNAIAQLLVLFSPLIAGLAINPVVTPANFPALNKGTVVTVITPGDAPNTKTTL
jgi:uncharacterized membrane protein